MFDREKKDEPGRCSRPSADQTEATVKTPLAPVGQGILARLSESSRAEVPGLQKSLLHMQRALGNRSLCQAMSDFRQAEDDDVDPSIEAAIRQQCGSGKPLEQQIKRRMESSFGADFSDVKVHTGSEADRLNRSLESEAFTTGKDMFFRDGTYCPENSSGRELLAHELTHVVQQGGEGGQGRMTVGGAGDRYETEADGVARDVMRQQQTGIGLAKKSTPRKLSAINRRLQRRLRFTGTAAHRARVLTLLNGGLFGYAVSTDSSGNISIGTNFELGTPTAEATALYNRLNTIISDSNQVNIAVESGGAALGGSYATSTIDVADLEAFGTGQGLSAVGALIHEIEEQYRKQVSGQGYAPAHAGGLVAETEQSGATRGTERFLSTTNNADGTIDALVEVPYTYPDGTTVTLTLTISHNNITRVTRR